MRIALVAPLIAPIAPPFLGGAQVVVRDLAAGLAARGHSVTLYAADGSEVPGARIVPLGIDASELRGLYFHPELPATPGAPDGAADGAATARATADPAFLIQANHFLRIALHIRAHAAEYDVVNVHAYDWPAFALSATLPLPVLHTLHNAATSRAVASVLRAITQAGAPNVRLAAVSRACAASYAGIAPVETVLYNGLDVDAIPFGAEPSSEGYLLYAGRIAPEKGVVDALCIAQQSGQRLVLAGGIYDQGYFTEEVWPLLSAMREFGIADYLGPQPRARVWELMAGALAVLCPAQWDEPFGLVAAEAQAAGAPVIGYARGALPEVVAEGATGWLVPPDDIMAASAAVARVGALSRATCRAHVAERFSLGAMLDAYERVYAKMAGGNA
ncbi:MAG TPA: glycosyltransferase [Ktedonobacterales bacterium]